MSHPPNRFGKPQVMGCRRKFSKFFLEVDKQFFLFSPMVATSRSNKNASPEQHGTRAVASQPKKPLQLNIL